MRPWIKLHTSTLDDTRILRLPERQQLRYFQLYLLAGRLNADGLFIENGSRLDDTDIAIKLRITDTKQFSADLKALKHAGLIKVNGKGPFVEAFPREQVDWNKKQEQERERKAKQRHADVTRDTNVTEAKSRKRHADVTPLDQDQTKKKKKIKKEKKNPPPTKPSSSKRKPNTAPASGGGGNGSSSFDWLDQIPTAGHETAKVIAPILRSSGLGQSKIVTLLSKVATRIKTPDAIRYTLAALASVYSDKTVDKPAIVAAYRIEQDSVPPIFLNSHTWNCLPAEVLSAADVDPARLPKPEKNAKVNDIQRVLGASSNG